MWEQVAKLLLKQECPKPFCLSKLWPTGCVLAEDSHEQGPAQSRKFVKSIEIFVCMCVCVVMFLQLCS